MGLTLWGKLEVLSATRRVVGRVGPKTVVRRILDSAEKDSIMEKLRDEIGCTIDQPDPR